jgi:hypothetical protein
MAAVQQAETVLKGKEPKHAKESLRFSKELLADMNRRLRLEKSVLLRECPQYLASLPQPTTESVTAAYTYAGKLLQQMQILTGYDGQHPATADARTLDELEQQAKTLWQMLTGLRTAFETTDPLRQLSFRQPCEFGYRSLWVENELQELGHKVYHWVRQLTVCKFDQQLMKCSCPLSDEVAAAIRLRLASEQAQMLRDLPPPQPKPKRSRKKSAVTPEKSQQEIAFAFLLLWHQYGTKNFNIEPIPAKQRWQQWMKERSPDRPVPNPVAVTRMMKARFGNMRKYTHHCQARTIERKLAEAVLESAKVGQTKLPKERSSADPEPDLD